MTTDGMRERSKTIEESRTKHYNPELEIKLLRADLWLIAAELIDAMRESRELKAEDLEQAGYPPWGQAGPYTGTREGKP